MPVLYLIATVAIVVVLAGILYAAFEKTLNHRAEMARLKFDSQGAANASVQQELQSLRQQLSELKERVDEQSILLDDVCNLAPRLAGPAATEEPVQRLQAM